MPVTKVDNETNLTMDLAIAFYDFLARCCSNGRHHPHVRT
jgi:hypothetical protein